MFQKGDYVRYEGRVWLVTYVDEYGLYVEDIDNDECSLILSDEYANVTVY